MLQLRQYQERSLDALEGFFGLATQHGAQKAFILQTNRPYLAVKQLPGLPYVCLRIPTGGGKHSWPATRWELQRKRSYKLIGQCAFG